MNSNTLRIGIDVGSVRHRVAVGLPDGTLIDEFDVDHHAAGFNQFFHRIAALERNAPDDGVTDDGSGLALAPRLIYLEQQ